MDKEFDKLVNINIVPLDLVQTSCNLLQGTVLLQVEFFTLQVVGSVTRLGDLLHFFATFQSRWQELFCPNSPHFW